MNNSLKDDTCQWIVSANKRIKFTIYFLIACLLIPLIITNTYQLHIVILIIINIGMASSLNLLMGYVGQISFAHAAFMGVGAYTSAILFIRYGLGYLPLLLISFIVALIFGLLLGLPSLRVRGHSLAIVTIGFQMIVIIVISQWVDLTRGPMGIHGIPDPSLFGIYITSIAGKYYIALGLTISIILLIALLIKSSIGLQFLAVRDNEVAASAIGIDIIRIKLIAFMLSAGMAGALGAFYAHYIHNVSPNAFQIIVSSTIMVMVLAGGQGSLIGPIIGALIITLIPEVFRFAAHYRLVIYGLFIIFIILYMQEGITGLFASERVKRTITNLFNIRRGVR